MGELLGPVGLLVLTSMQITAIRGNALARDISKATCLARSMSVCVSVAWLKISTRSPRAGGFSIAICMQRTVSVIWMNARVCPPVP